MSEVSASAVMELRRKSGAGVMECRKALQRANGDAAAAAEILREESRDKAGAKMGRDAGEGGIALVIDGAKGALVEVNSETDFAARTQEFRRLAHTLARLALKHGGSVEALLAADWPNNGRASVLSVAEHMRELVGGTIRENLRLRRAEVLDAPGAKLFGYAHNRIEPNLGRLAALVAVESEASESALWDFGKQLAMHVAANAPESVEAMAEQDFVMDAKVSVAKAVAAAGESLGASVRVVGFLRFALAEPLAEEDG